MSEEKRPKKIDVEYKLGELVATVKRLNHAVEQLTHRVESISQRLESFELDQRLSSSYIMISKRKFFSLLGSILGSLGSLIYYIYLLLSGK
ncbi:MAG: hypothetical protein QW238_07625 [Candidatus Bathyarchaeia archaeon]